MTLMALVDHRKVPTHPFTSPYKHRSGNPLAWR